MYNITPTFLKKVCSDCSRSLVGKICRRIELLEQNSELSEEEKFSVLREFVRELIYEHFRDLKNQLKSFTLGLVHQKYKPISPKDHCEK